MRQYKSNFVRTAMQYAAVLMLGLMLLVGPASCKKDPQPNPTPNVPTDTITPVIPGDTILPPTPPIDTIQPGGDTIVPGPGGDTIVPGGGKVVKFYYEGGADLVPFDTLQRYQDDPTYDTIYLAIRLTCGDSWTPDSYTALCQNLRPRFARFSKLHGRLGIRPYQILPNADSMNMHVMGIAELHRDYLVSKGYYVRPVIGKSNPRNTKPQVYKGSMILPRKNCGRGRGEAGGTINWPNVGNISACPTGYTYGGTGLYAQNQCKASCSAGQCLPTANGQCVNAGAGNWSAGGTVAYGSTLACNACASGLTTIGYGHGADEADDCGRILHVGENHVYLRSGEKTNPSLHVKIGSTVFYGNMSTTMTNMSDGINHKLKMKYNNATYSVYDDSAQN